MVRWLRLGVYGGAVLLLAAGGASYADVSASITGTPTATLTIGGNTGGGYFHGPTGQLDTRYDPSTLLFIGEQTLAPITTYTPASLGYPNTGFGNLGSVNAVVPLGTSSNPDSTTGSVEYGIYPQADGSLAIGTAQQTHAEADFTFPLGNTSTAAADIKVAASASFHTTVTVHTSELYTLGVFFIPDTPGDGSQWLFPSDLSKVVGAGPITSGASATSASTIVLHIIDPVASLNETLSYNDSDGVFSFAQFLNAGATVGVDISAKDGIYEVVRQLAAQGLAVIMISDEIPEVYYHCHRVRVMRAGRLGGEFVPGQCTENELKEAVDA